MYKLSSTLWSGFHFLQGPLTLVSGVLRNKLEKAGHVMAKSGSSGDRLCRCQLWV